MFVYVVGGHFDCGAMHHYLFKNHYSLEKLPYDQIKYDLVAREVITYEEKRIMDQFIDKLWTTVFDNVQRDLYQGKSRKFKVFLQIMEDSDVPLLQDTAKRLGK